MTTESNCDLLVVGAGPVGLTMAAEATRQGLTCRLIEKNAEPSAYSKAQVIHARSMEILEDMGVAQAIRAQAGEVHAMNLFADRGTKRLAHIELSGVDSQFPHMLSLSQRETELILAEHLESLGGAVAWRHELAGFSQVNGGVVAEVAAPGGTERVHARWLAGCDGAHSTVRHALDLEFSGEKYPIRFIQADIRVTLPFPLPGDEAIAFLSTGGLIALIPFKTSGRYRMLVPLDESSTLEPTLEGFQQVMREFGPDGAVVDDPEWMVEFNIHCRQVSAYRHGPVFLAGDAAHVHSPAGGQGMNMGIQDAYNLTWKLGLVKRGLATDALLESYHAERHPVGAATLRMTDRATQGALFNLRLRNPVAVGLRNRMIQFLGSFDALGRVLPERFSMLDVGYANSPIVGQDHVSVFAAEVLPGHAHENPTVCEWLAFGHGPAPGHRALDVILGEDDPESTRLFGILRGTHHSLLLFDGVQPTRASHERLEAIARAVRERYGEVIVPHIVLTAGSHPEHLSWDGSVIHDQQARLHQTYGARFECLYLLRPDDHVAYRNQPADLEKLQVFLKRFLV
jgi:2-polyprenyl-6-methoxyphenol hydroxylase-like FAD-dependent oxidoreductase